MADRIVDKIVSKLVSRRPSSELPEPGQPRFPCPELPPSIIGFMDDDGIPYVRPRIANACDGCKARKVKCDGKLPCSYCARRKRAHACTYSPQKRRRATREAPTPVSRHHSHNGSLMHEPPLHDASPSVRGEMHTPSTTREDRGGRDGGESRPSLEAEADTEVPREARLVCDAQGKLIFIGDCAPLSFFQSVRQLVTTRVESNAFAPESSRFSVLEVSAPTQQIARPSSHGTPAVWPNTVSDSVLRYLSTTAGVIDLFDNARLLDDMQLWASLDRKPLGSTSIINYLVLAIGIRTEDDAKSEEYFEYSRERALTGLSNDLSVATVQAFALITMYMLSSCQINGAFLYFGIAVRAAYSVGIHRTEVNARFGPEIHLQRDRLWKSLRVVDLYLSTSMGRPPATSDVDCSVPYKANANDGSEAFDILNASVQILLVIEGIVEEIYSRKKISLQLTEGISVQLREWSNKWLHRLKQVEPDGAWNYDYNGACQVMSTYYYAVMLVSRPFLMYELCRNLDGPQANGKSLATGKSRLADACIDSASLMVDSIQDGICRYAFSGVKRINSSMPLLVPWLFASSLVLGVGLLGGFGHVLEKRCRQSIEALDHFAKHNAHAEQYSLIAQSLLSVSLDHLEKRELQERMQRTENSSQLFGLLPPRRPLDSPGSNGTPRQASTPTAVTPRARDHLNRDEMHQHSNLLSVGSPSLGEVDSAFLGLSDSGGLQSMDGGYWGAGVGNDADQASALNLFNLLDSGGGIDLAHYV